MVIGHENPTNSATSKVATFPYHDDNGNYKRIDQIPTKLLSIETGHRILHGFACGLELLKETRQLKERNTDS